MWWDVAAQAGEQVVGHDVDAGVIVVLHPALPPEAFSDPASLSHALAQARSASTLATCLESPRGITLLVSAGWQEAWSFGATPSQLALAPSPRADALCESEKLGCGWQRLWSRSADPGLDAAIRRRGAQSAAGVDEAVSAFAKDLHGTVVVGGLLLPAPGAVAGRLVATGGPPQEVAVVWGPDGLVRAVVPSHAPAFKVAVASQEPPQAWTSALGATMVWIGAEPDPSDVERVEALGVTTIVSPDGLSLDGWRRLAEGGVRLGVAAAPASWLGAAGPALGPEGPWCVWAEPAPPAPEAEEAWEAAQAPAKLKRR